MVTGGSPISTKLSKLLQSFSKKQHQQLRDFTLRSRVSSSSSLFDSVIGDFLVFLLLILVCGGNGDVGGFWKLWSFRWIEIGGESEDFESDLDLQIPF